MAVKGQCLNVGLLVGCKEAEFTGSFRNGVPPFQDSSTSPGPGDVGL